MIHMRMIGEVGESVIVKNHILYYSRLGLYFNFITFRYSCFDYHSLLLAITTSIANGEDNCMNHCNDATE
jgi:hypothetical protein